MAQESKDFYADTLIKVARSLREGEWLGAVSMRPAISEDYKVPHTGCYLLTKGKVIQIDFSITHHFAFQELYRAGICAIDPSTGRHFYRSDLPKRRADALPEGQGFILPEQENRLKSFSPEQLTDGVRRLLSPASIAKMFAGGAIEMRSIGDVRDYEILLEDLFQLPHKLILTEFDLAEYELGSRSFIANRLEPFQTAAIFTLSQQEAIAIQKVVYDIAARQSYVEPPFQLYGNDDPIAYNCASFTMDALGIAKNILGYGLERVKGFGTADAEHMFLNITQDQPSIPVSLLGGTVEHVGVSISDREIHVLHNNAHTLEISGQSRPATLLDYLAEFVVKMGIYTHNDYYLSSTLERTAINQDASPDKIRKYG